MRKQTRPSSSARKQGSPRRTNNRYTQSRLSPRSKSSSTLSQLVGDSSPPPCSSPGKARIGGIRKSTLTDQIKFVKARTSLGALTPKLACEDEGGTVEAASAAWVNIADASGYWAQMGWSRERSAGSTTITRFVYLELTYFDSVNNKPDRLFQRRQDPGEGSKEYRIELDQPTGTWHFYFDGNELTFDNYPEEAKYTWKRNYGSEAKWCGEIWDLNSHMPGVVINKCVFVNCSFKQPGDLFWEDANFDYFTPQPSTNYTSRIDDATTLEVWDLR